MLGVKIYEELPKGYKDYQFKNEEERQEFVRKMQQSECLYDYEEDKDGFLQMENLDPETNVDNVSITSTLSNDDHPNPAFEK